MHAIQEEATPHAQPSQNPQIHLQQLSDSQKPLQHRQNGMQQPLQQGQNGFQHALQEGQATQQPLDQGQNGIQPPQNALSQQTQIWHEQTGGSSPLLEAVLGHGLSHPNIVQTYKHATQAMRVSSAPESSHVCYRFDVTPHEHNELLQQQTAAQSAACSALPLVLDSDRPHVPQLNIFAARGSLTIVLRQCKIHHARYCKYFWQSRAAGGGYPPPPPSLP